MSSAFILRFFLNLVSINIHLQILRAETLEDGNFLCSNETEKLRKCDAHSKQAYQVCFKSDMGSHLLHLGYNLFQKELCAVFPYIKHHVLRRKTKKRVLVYHLRLSFIVTVHILSCLLI